MKRTSFNSRLLPWRQGHRSWDSDTQRPSGSQRQTVGAERGAARRPKDLLSPCPSGYERRGGTGSGGEDVRPWPSGGGCGRKSAPCSESPPPAAPTAAVAATHVSVRVGVLGFGLPDSPGLTKL